jgi:hypothetical protein
MLACVCILVGMWHLLNTNQPQLYNKMHNVSKAYNWGFANSSKNGKLDIHDNKK